MIFIKDDILDNLLDNLKKVHNIENCHIVFLQDNIIGSKFFDNKKYFNNFNNCKNIINKRIVEFKSAEYMCNEYNKNVYETHYDGLKYCFNKYKYVIYIEDDVITNYNFLNYFNYFIDNDLLGINKEYQFLGGESIFFDSQKNDYIFSDKTNRLLLNCIEEKKLYKYYISLNSFCPSSCFCISDDVWEKIKHIKNQSLSDTKLNNYIKDNNLNLAMPIVPMCRDIGMLHDNGYSVAIHTKANVREIKNAFSYNDIKCNLNYELFKENVDKLYSEIKQIIS